MPVSVKKNIPRSAKRIGLSGKAGCGKTSTIFKMYKNPLIFDLENKIPPKFAGLGEVVDLKGRDSQKVIKDEILLLLNEQKPTWDAIVFDTTSKLEEHCESHAIQIDYKNDRGKYSAYSSGIKNELPQYFAELLDLIARVQDRHNIDIVMLCHAKPKLQNNVMGKDYYKMVLDLKDDVSAKLLKWFDYLGFIWDDVVIDEESFRAKAIKETRVISFDNTNPLFDAKSLKVLPAKIPFDEDGKWIETVFGKAA